MSEDEKRVETWGTYSVRDHLRARPFVTDVFLYDRLMIPRPPNPEEEAADESLAAEDRGKEYTRWREAQWDPDRQLTLLKILREKDLTVELPWDKRAREQWAAFYQGPSDEESKGLVGDARSKLLLAAQREIEMAKSQAPTDAPYLATAGLISQYVKGTVQNDVARKLIALTKVAGTEIQSVVAYSSYVDFVTQQLLRENGNKDESVESDNGYRMFGWQVDVPEDPGLSDEEMLRKAVGLASRSDLREKRQSFHAQLNQLAEGKVEPAEAVEKMEGLLTEYQAIVRGSGVKTAVRWVAKALPIVAPLAGLFFGPAVSAGAGFTGAATSPVVGWFLPKREPDDRVLPAAIVHDIRSFQRRH